MSAETSAGMKPVLEEVREQCLVFGSSGDAIANIARRQNIELLAESAAGAAIVCDRHHSAKISDA